MHIITISRQFGSGGRELGKRLADRLGWDYYDREIIDSIARDHGLDPEFVKAAFALDDLRVTVFVSDLLRGPLLGMANLMDDLFDRPDQRRVLAAFRPLDFLLHHRQRHDVHMVVVNRMTELFREGGVQFIGVHDRRDDIPQPILLFSKVERFLVELPGVLIATALLEVGRVHIEDHFIEYFGILLQAA